MRVLLFAVSCALFACQAEPAMADLNFNQQVTYEQVK